MAEEKDKQNSSGIYRIVCAATGKVYVGSAINIRERWWTHRTDLRRGKHRNRHLQNAWTKYGEEAFTFEIVEEVEPAFLVECEQRHIDSYAPTKRFNIALKAGSNLGMKWPPEVLAKFSASHKGKHLGAEQRAKISASLIGKTLGRKLSAETRAKISVVQIGKVASAETREKMSRAHRGNQCGLGYVHTPEAKAKISAALFARGPRSAETRAKISDGNKGKTHSAETRAKISAAVSARGPISAETRAKLSESHKGQQRCLGYKHSPETRAKVAAASMRMWANRRAAKQEVV
jgi:group I intron endonuclease